MSNKDDIERADVPKIQPNQGGHSNEFAEHGQKKPSATRATEQHFSDTDGEAL